jgi:hypothetical protein
MRRTGSFTLFTDVHQWTLSRRLILLLPSHLRLGLPRNLLCLGFPTKILLAFLVSHTHAALCTYPAWTESWIPTRGRLASCGPTGCVIWLATTFVMCVYNRSYTIIYISYTTYRDFYTCVTRTSPKYRLRSFSNRRLDTPGLNNRRHRVRKKSTNYDVTHNALLCFFS